MRSMRVLAGSVLVGAFCWSTAGCVAEGENPTDDSSAGAAGETGSGGPGDDTGGSNGSSSAGSGGSVAGGGGGSDSGGTGGGSGGSEFGGTGGDGTGGTGGVGTGGVGTGGVGTGGVGTGGVGTGGVGTGGVGTGGVGTGGVGTGGVGTGGTSTGGTSTGGTSTGGTSTGGTGGGTSYPPDPCPTGDAINCADDCGGKDPACGTIPCAMNNPFNWGSPGNTYTIRTSPASSACGCSLNYQHVTFGFASTPATLRITINPPWSLYEKRFDTPMTQPWTPCDDQPSAAQRSQCLISPPVPDGGFRLISAITEDVDAPPMNMVIETVSSGATCP